MTADALAVYADVAAVRARWAATVDGAQLHPGSVVVDLAGDEHRIDHLRPYPGAFKGDHARRAYEHADEHGWCCTVADHEPFHVLPEGEDQP